MNYNRLARKLRSKIARFSGEVSAGLPVVARKFVGDMLYGIQASQSVVLTKVGRTLEEAISIKKVEERLSRQLGRKGLGAKVQRNLLRMASGRIEKDTLLILDLSDLRKKYAEKMQYLATIRDGSEGELGNGYWLCKVVAAEMSGGKEIVPLMGKLYSCESPEHISENVEILDGIDEVCAVVGRQRGIWVIDRGGDRKHLIEPMLNKGRRFLIRLVGDRNLVHGTSTELASDIARRCSCPYAETIVKVDGNKEKVYHLEFGYRKVRFPGRNEPLYLLVVRGFGEDPMMLLTTEPLRRNRKVLWRMVQSYIRRWSIEETIRFIKQSYDLEDVRVLRYRRLQNILPLVMAASYFAAVVLDTKAKLKVMTGYVLKAAKRLFGIPDFHYYAIADGLTNIFQRHPRRIIPFSSKISTQMSLLFSDP